MEGTSGIRVSAADRATRHSFHRLESPTLEYVGVFTAIAILLLAVWLLGVRDPRCYAVFILWLPTMTAWQNANVSALWSWRVR